MNWREALMKYLTPDNSDYTLTPMNKKLLPQEIIAPSMKEESLKDIVIAIDTSGSIDNEDLKVFMSELNGILRSFRNVSGYITACDADVHDFFEFDSNSDVVSMKVHGGGGTDFRPVFNRIKEKWLTPACVVFFTDGDGTFPPETDYPDYPVLWVIKNSQKTEAPFGITVYFE
jgi:predicted metal-dependent peptidase